jgi:hypothetical protein
VIEATEAPPSHAAKRGEQAARPESWRTWTFRNHLIGSLLVLGVGSIMIAGWSLATGGIGWDAPTDTWAALQVRAVPSSDSLAQAYNSVYLTSEFYGVFIQQFADLLHTLFTGSTHHLQPDDPATYLYQGGVTLALSVISVSALAVAVGVVFRSVLAGAFAWSLTLSTPLWLGMSHLDYKDVPFAAGLNLITAGLIFSVVIGRPQKAALLGLLLACPGVAVALAVRPGSLLLLAALLAVTCGAVAAFAIACRRPGAVLAPVITSLAALAVAVAFIWATNPLARIDLVQWLHDASKVSLAYPWDGTIRTAGGDVRSGHLPWWYVPAWLGAQLPLLTIAALVGGLTVLGAFLVRRRRDVGGATTIALVPLALQGIVLPIGILVNGAVIYDGIRHLLFMIPALIALGAGAMALLDRRTRRGSRLRVALPLAAALVVAASLVDSARWAPYAYAHINPIAGHNTHSQSWELDYWGVSAREGVARLHKAGLSSVSVQPAQQVGLPFGAVPYTGVFGENAGIYVFSRWGFTAASFGCDVLFTIKRDGHTLGEGAKCPPHVTSVGFR